MQKLASDSDTNLILISVKLKLTAVRLSFVGF